MKKLSYAQKYALYCEFVQDPKRDIRFLTRVYKKIRKGKIPMRVKEDFCGSFYFSSEWIKSNPKREAVSVDIDWEPLKQGFHTYYNELSTQQKDRLTIVQADVCQKFGDPVDVNFASNFSYCCLKDRNQLKKYFASVYANLNKNGIFVMDNFGGADTLFPCVDRSSTRFEGERWWYEWELKKFNPNTHEALYAIHFSRSKKKREYPNVFTYDWRMWTLPELTDILKEVGFKDVQYYWENNRDILEFKPMGDLSFSVWIVHIVAVK